MPKTRAVTRTFSMRKDLVDALEKEARSRDISTSALMNQTIERCVNLTWPSDKTGALVIARDIVYGLLEALSVEEVEKIGALSAQRHKNTATIVIGTKQDLEAVLDLLAVTYGKNARWFKFTHVVNGRNNRVLLNHEMGLKWSCFLEGYMRSFFMEMLDIPVKSSYTDNTVVLEFKT
ncbi:MAG: hypothetical protein NTY03_03355 [Candidatus Bathyarchaeota archaeon]|nr:hypothetical protein [Candidatus Bathyarchaeota archaeon]